MRAGLEHALPRARGSTSRRAAWRELALFHNQVVALFERELDVIKLIVATIVVLGIANTIGMSIVERRVELATLRALGLGAPAIAASAAGRGDAHRSRWAACSASGSGVVMRGS